MKVLFILSEAASIVQYFEFQFVDVFSVLMLLGVVLCEGEKCDNLIKSERKQNNFHIDFHSRQ